MKLDDDALDRALCSQPLEEPPPDLRASILARTAYRAAPPFSIGEIVAVASVVGVVLWLLVGMGPVIGSAIASAFSNVTTLLWLAAGAAVTFWLEFFTSAQPSRALARRAKGHARP